jgi:hypothetical protein
MSSTTPSAQSDSHAARGERSRQARRIPGQANSSVTPQAVAIDQQPHIAATAGFELAIAAEG